MCSFFSSQKKSVLFPPQGKSERMEFLDDFFERFFAEISDFYHILFGFACQILDRIDARALQAVEATNGQVKLLNGHLKYFFFLGFFSFNHDLRSLCFFGKINKEIEMFVEYLGSERYSLSCGDGTVRQHVNCEFVKVYAVSYTCVFNVVVYVIDRGENRIDENHAKLP